MRLVWAYTIEKKKASATSHDQLVTVGTFHATDAAADDHRMANSSLRDPAKFLRISFAVIR